MAGSDNDDGALRGLFEPVARCTRLLEYSSLDVERDSLGIAGNGLRKIAAIEVIVFVVHRQGRDLLPGPPSSCARSSGCEHYGLTDHAHGCRNLIYIGCHLVSQRWDALQRRNGTIAVSRIRRGRLAGSKLKWPNSLGFRVVPRGHDKHSR